MNLRCFTLHLSPLHPFTFFVYLCTKLFIMDAQIESKVNAWLSEGYDQETKNEINRLLKENPNELKEAFYKNLEFGTGGLRGIMGVGTNRMNKYTVASATQGFANYLKKQFPQEAIKVVIAYDSRHQSDFFAQVSAEVLSANNIYCYLFEELRPTPELSFAVRHLQCHAGIMITASHNPKEYNGYKAYWNDGGQLVPPHDTNVIDEVNKVDSLDKIAWTKQDNLIEKIGKKVDEAYLALVHGVSLNQEAIQKQKNLKIVYTPLHGTGITMVPQALQLFGFQQIDIVEEQAVPNGAFPTVSYPNPEEPAALKMAIDKAEQLQADVVMATDPDADRVGIAARNEHGEMVLLSGNELATLLTYYVLDEKRRQQTLEANDFVIKTIVTTELIQEIAADYQVTCHDVLTGFKHIAAKIRELEGKCRFLCGGEESYGFMFGDFVRDKDAVSTCCMVAELAAVLATRNQTLPGLLQELFHRYTYYKEAQISITKKGMSGAEEIAEMMRLFRENPPETINQSKVIERVDCLTGKKYDFITQNSTDTGLPSSNVLQFLTEDGSKITVRPSGTEPKIKFYISVKEKIGQSSKEEVEKILNHKIENIKKTLKLT